MKTPLFTGAATAVVTPFREDEIDLTAFSQLIERQYKGGVSALVVCGTTGENPTLSYEEHELLFRFAAEQSAGRMKIIAGVGSNDTKKAMKLTRIAEDAGVDGLLMVTPYYNKTSQRGLTEHFTYVADRSRLPVIVYNVPSRTGIGIAPQTYAVLADHPNIVGVKEASGNISDFALTKALCGDRLTFWSGNDSDTVAMMALGAKGVISVASNIVPDVVAQLCRLCLAEDFAAAAALNEKYMDLFHGLFIEVNPVPVKAAMGLLGQCSPALRLPLIPISSENRNKVRAILEAHQILQ